MNTARDSQRPAERRVCFLNCHFRILNHVPASIEGASLELATAREPVCRRGQCDVARAGGGGPGPALAGVPGHARPRPRAVMVGFPPRWSIHYCTSTTGGGRDGPA